jgi:hypothetical protein
MLIEFLRRAKRSERFAELAGKIGTEGLNAWQ